MRESEIIARYIKPLAQGFTGALGLCDDAALLNIPAAMELVVSTDMMREGVHFLKNATPQDVAWKLMGANLSDIAAMGGQAVWYQLALCLTHQQDEPWINGFTDALADIQTRYAITLTGGDTINDANGLTASITMFGLVPTGSALKRSNAHIADHIFVTGTLGDAAIGLELARGEMPDMPHHLVDYVMQRYWRPTPRLSVGVALRGIANASMDISDGLLIDCAKLCAASDVRAELHYDTLPLSDAGRYVHAHNPECFMRCISAGDDYELLFTVAENKLALLNSLIQTIDTPITYIGNIKAGAGVLLHDSNGKRVRLPIEGYEHS